VGLDHQEYLGDSLQKIAADKAHISRRNVPFVVGEMCVESFDAVCNTAAKIGSIPLRAVDLQREHDDLVRRMVESGSPWHRLNEKNLRTAVAALSAYERFSPRDLSLNWDAVEFGLGSAFWPGRFDVRTIEQRRVVFDGAHNSSGIEYFFEQYDKSEFSGIKPQVLYASLSDKDWNFILPQLLKRASSMILTAVASPRAVPLSDLSQIISGDNIVCKDSVKAALEFAFTSASDVPLLVVGSLSLVGEAMEMLGVDPLFPSSGPRART
jgi:dihydrofolate synthase/folylpolyglutamate synthase